MTGNERSRFSLSRTTPTDSHSPLLFVQQWFWPPVTSTRTVPRSAVSGRTTQTTVTGSDIRGELQHLILGPAEITRMEVRSLYIFSRKAEPANDELFWGPPKTTACTNFLLFLQRVTTSTMKVTTCPTDRKLVCWARPFPRPPLRFVSSLCTTCTALIIPMCWGF